MPIEGNPDGKEANVKVGMTAGGLHELCNTILETH